MPRAFLFVLFLVLAGFQQRGLEAQDRSSQEKPATLFDADASRAQKAVQTLIQKGTTEYRTGDYASAIKTFKDALRQLRSLPEVKSDEDSILVRAGRAYIGERSFDDAMSTLALLLWPRMEDCRQGVAAVEYCADAQRYIGFARMQNGDFDAAVPFLIKSIASYARAASGSEYVAYRMIKQAETETMLAQALLHTCHKDGAINSLNHAIAQLNTVTQNAEIQESVRASAGKSLLDARVVFASTEAKIPSPPGCAN